MLKILDADATESQEIAPSLPTWVRIQGAIEDRVVQLQSRLKSENIWNLEYVFTEGVNKSCIIPGIEGASLIFKVVVSKPGITAYRGTANVSFDAR